jgi:murein DD-endopeptidase MepM/ murein hydrolase activator NlpD
VPAALGVVALFVAGGGSVVASSGASQAAQAPEYAPLVQNIAGGVESLPGTRLQAVEVSRSIEVDRETLNKQAQTQAAQRTKALAELVQAANATAKDLREEARRARQAEREQVNSNQWVLPLAGYQLTATWGEVSSYWATYHTGLDFAAPSGTPLLAVAHGVVTYVGYDGAYGNKTEITLDDGTVIWYAHQTSQSVSVGQEVQPGQQIGTVGATGNVSGPHLHLEVRVGATGGGDGSDVDPYGALVEHGVTP